MQLLDDSMTGLTAAGEVPGGLVLPLTISGTLDEPYIRIDDSP
jgi:hypothetical protein